MAKITVEFNTDSAAFTEHEAFGRSEIDRILAVIGSRIKDGRISDVVLDSNGNTVGSWRWDR